MDEHRHTFEVLDFECMDGHYWAACECGETALVGGGEVVKEGRLVERLDQMKVRMDWWERVLHGLAVMLGRFL